LVKLGEVYIAVMNFGVCDFSRFAVTDWRLWFLALITATRTTHCRDADTGMNFQYMHEYFGNKRVSLVSKSARTRDTFGSHFCISAFQGYLRQE